eukprot:1040118-Rhodomonas_salina.1
MQAALPFMHAVLPFMQAALPFMHAALPFMQAVRSRLRRGMLTCARWRAEEARRHVRRLSLLARRGRGTSRFLPMRVLCAVRTGVAYGATVSGPCCAMPGTDRGCAGTRAIWLS